MEGEKNDDSDILDTPRIERRTSPTDSIFGNPNDGGNDLMANQTTTLGREVSEEAKVHRGIPLGKARTLGEDEAPVLRPVHTKSAAFLGEHKVGHIPSVKLRDLGEDSDASDEPLINEAKPRVDHKISEKNMAWQHPKNESDSIVIRKSDETAGQSNMAAIPQSVLAPPILPSTPKEKEHFPMFDERALEHRSNKALQAFSLLGLGHLICVLLFAANTFYVPIYDLKDNDTGDAVGKITFQKVEIFCDECDDTTTLASNPYLEICGIGEANEGFTDGFVSDYKAAALFSFIAFLMAAGNIAIILVVFCFLLARKIANPISQVLIVIGGLVSLGELLIGLIIPLHTQLGTWNRDKVNDIFAVSEFECEGSIYVFSSFGFLLVWIVLGCVLIDIVLTQRLFSLVRIL